LGKDYERHRYYPDGGNNLNCLKVLEGLLGALRTIEAGMDDCLAKPFNRDVFFRPCCVH
jgi:hypothetical protein